MRDISKATGLSIFAVSRTLNGGEGVAEESRNQIRKVARELGYIPNRAAQALRRVSRDSVALITAGSSNAYYLELLSGIQEAMRPSDWTIVVGDVTVDDEYDPHLEERVIRRLIEARVAGVISTITLRPECVSLLAQWDIPLVFVDSTPPAEAERFPSVTTDNHHAGRLVGEHLAWHGYRDWLFLAYPATWSSRISRERGLSDAARVHDARLAVLESGNSATDAASTLAAYLDRTAPHPDVLIAGNNPLLLGAFGLLKERGIRVPDDMAVVAYDEFGWAALIDPPVTVLDEHSGEIGRRAAATLAEIIADQASADRRGERASPAYRPGYRQQVPADLIVRRSCGCALPSGAPLVRPTPGRHESVPNGAGQRGTVSTAQTPRQAGAKSRRSTE